MFKISTNLSSRTFRVHLGHKFRNYATPSDPRRSSPSMGGYYAVGALTVIGGVTLCYAKYDTSFRKYLKANIPISDDVIKFVFQEEKTFEDRYRKIETKIDNIKSTFSLNEAIPTKTSDIKNVQPKQEGNKVIVSPVSFPDPIIENTEQSNQDLKVENISEKKSIENNKVDELTIIEKGQIEITESAIKSYNLAITSLRDFTHQIDEIIEQNFHKIDAKLWHQLKILSQQKDEAIQHAEQTFQQVASQINNIDLKTKLNTVRNEFVNELQQMDITNRFWEQIEHSRKQYELELSILCPSLNKPSDLSPAELDLFILYSGKKLEFLQKELIKLETKRERELNNALNRVSRDGLIDSIVEEEIKMELDKEKRKLEEEYLKKSLEAQVDAEREIVAQLKRATEAHADHLADAIKSKQSELERAFTKRLNEEITKAKLEYKEQLASMVGRLKGVDSALKVRADADRNAHQAQALWSACQALHQAIKSSDAKIGGDGVETVNNIQPLSNEISAIKIAASENDELVGAVINTIPEVALNRGVFNESALRQRFPKVCEVAKRLAFVPEEGARLPIYLLSYIQSLLLIDAAAAAPITKEELNDDVVDFSQFTTNDILQRARYWIDRGDFHQTLRYMNLLTGASRVVAEQWMKEVQILLETKQAANTLMAHAAANGLVYL